MNNLKSIITIVLSFFIVGMASAKKTDLTLKLSKGDIYNINMTMQNKVDQHIMGQDISVNQDMLIKMQMHVIDELKSGNYLIEEKYSYFKLDMLVNGKESIIDSETIEEGRENPLSALKNLVISFEVSPKGVVKNVKGLEGIIEKIGSNPQIAGVLKGVVSDQQIVAFYSYLPKNTITTGENYEVVMTNEALMNLSTTTLYTVKEINKENVVLDVLTDFGMSGSTPLQQNGMDVNMKTNGKQVGDFIVSRKDGMPISSKSDTDLHIDVSFKNPENGEDMNMPMDMKVISTFTMTKQAVN